MFQDFKPMAEKTDQRQIIGLFDNQRPLIRNVGSQPLEEKYNFLCF